MHLPGEAIISALIGLVGACNNNPKTAQTDHVLIKALSMCGDGAAEQALLEEIRAEKYAIAPDCAVCANPCGNTSDYEMARLYAAAEEIRDIKLQILSALQQTAGMLLHAPETEIDLFYKALLYVGSDLDSDPLRALLGETQAFQKKIGGNTEK